MPVHLTAPDPQSLLPIAGVALGVTEAGIRKKERKDLLLMRLKEGAQVAGVFTQNRFCAAPVIVAREHLAAGAGIRALLVNTGNANAGTGAAGIANARSTCDALAHVIGCKPTQVLPFSTGVIMEPLPVERVTAGLPNCLIALEENNWLAAAQAIMTTDTVPKATSRQVNVHGKTITVTGIAKGSGMIHPNMATMLGYIATDANLSAALVQDAVQYAAQRSFNCITVDGDTSTNDAFILIASGAASDKTLDDANDAGYQALRATITEVAIELAQAIVRDGEGATKFITIKVEGGRDAAECRQVGYAVAHSPLVKTAFFASDPNLGRILAAIGYAGIADLDTGKIQLYLDDVLVATEGGRNPAYQEADGQRVMKQEEITVRIVLGRGDAEVILWTCDFSYDYVKINADYRS